MKAIRWWRDSITLFSQGFKKVKTKGDSTMKIRINGFGRIGRDKFLELLISISVSTCYNGITLGISCIRKKKAFKKLKKPEEYYYEFRKYVKEQLIKDKSVPSSWKTLCICLDKIEEKIEKKLEEVLAPRLGSNNLGFWYFNRHNFKHIKRTIGFLWELQEFLKTKQVELTPCELYTLYFAALFHDIGMSVWNLELIEAYENVFGEINRKKIRKFHGPAGTSILEEILKHYIPKFLLVVIGEIASYHSGEVSCNINESVINIDGEKIRRDMLIALLRIADTMDAGEERLPSDEIIAQAIALASTHPKLFRTQFEHYMRRDLVLSCVCNKEGIILSVRREFSNSKITRLKRVKEGSVTITGKRVFLGLLKEFAKELGLPKNYNDLKNKYPDLEWSDLEKTAKIKASNQLLKKQIGLEIPWKVELRGNDKGIISKWLKWEKMAKNLKKYFDNKKLHLIKKF